MNKELIFVRVVRAVLCTTHDWSVQYRLVRKSERWADSEEVQQGRQSERTERENPRRGWTEEVTKRNRRAKLVENERLEG